MNWKWKLSIESSKLYELRDNVYKNKIWWKKLGFLGLGLKKRCKKIY